MKASHTRAFSGSCHQSPRGRQSSLRSLFRAIGGRVPSSATAVASFHRTPIFAISAPAARQAFAALHNPAIFCDRGPTSATGFRRAPHGATASRGPAKHDRPSRAPAPYPRSRPRRTRLVLAALHHPRYPRSRSGASATGSCGARNPGGWRSRTGTSHRAVVVAPRECAKKAIPHQMKGAKENRPSWPRLTTACSGLATSVALRAPSCASR
jgi:hypothetical protein